MHASVAHALACSWTAFLRYFVWHCPAVAPSLRDETRVLDLEYADDVALLSQRAAGLQGLIDAANALCTQVGMRISAQRTFVTVFGAIPERFAWTCGGQSVQCVALTLANTLVCS